MCVCVGGRYWKICNLTDKGSPLLSSLFLPPLSFPLSSPPLSFPLSLPLPCPFLFLLPPLYPLFLSLGIETQALCAWGNWSVKEQYPNSAMFSVRYSFNSPHPHCHTLQASWNFSVFYAGLEPMGSNGFFHISFPISRGYRFVLLPLEKSASQVVYWVWYSNVGL